MNVAFKEASLGLQSSSDEKHLTDMKMSKKHSKCVLFCMHMYLHVNNSFLFFWTPFRCYVHHDGTFFCLGLKVTIKQFYFHYTMNCTTKLQG